MVLFQGFGWESHKDCGPFWVSMLDKVAPLKAAGCTHLWLPPPSQSVAPQGYLPGQLYNLNSSYGNEEQLKTLLTALKEAGISPLGDIVINHRCADVQDANGVWNRYSDDVDHEGSSVDWGRWAITSDDPDFGGTGNPDTGDDYGPAPDLDHTNDRLREALVHWMQALSRDIGFDSWRFDFVRGYAARFMPQYIRDTVGDHKFNVGEYFADLDWEDGRLCYDQRRAKQVLADWIDEAEATAALFDFPTKGILQQAFQTHEFNRLRDCDGKAAGLIGWWPERSVTFVDNHDTGSKQRVWPFPDEHVVAGYAYLMTHPGIPCVLAEHFFEWGLSEELTQLINIRRLGKITSNARLEILRAEPDLYIARVNDRVLVKIGGQMDMGAEKPSSKEWVVAMTGNLFAIWTRRKRSTC